MGRKTPGPNGGGTSGGGGGMGGGFLSSFMKRASNAYESAKHTVGIIGDTGLLGFRLFGLKGILGVFGLLRKYLMYCNIIPNSMLPY